MYIHPRGWVYFRSEEYKIVFDEDIRVPETLERITSICIKENLSLLSGGQEFCIAGFNSNSALYLVIDHTQCTARYGFELSSATQPIHNIPLSRVLRHRQRYWHFVSQHPTHVSVPQDMLMYTVDIIKSYYFDNLTQGTKSTVPFTKAECEELLRILDVPHYNTSDRNMVSTNMFIAWILRETYSFRRAERYGALTFQQTEMHRQSTLRPHFVWQSSSRTSRNCLWILINGPLFGIPYSYLENVQRASEFQGRLSSLHQAWQTYTDQLTKEYSDFILVSTVLLSATVGLLSVGNIYQMARVCAIMSAFASLGSITTGVFFVWRHQHNTNLSSSHTFAYMNNARKQVLGLPGHSILLSLPAALLMWSLIGFMVALSAYSLQSVTDGSMTDVATTFIIFGVFFLVLCCMFMAVYTFSLMWRWRAGSSPVSCVRRLFR